MIHIKTQSEIEAMRRTCKLAAQTLQMISKHVKPGISTLELNDICHEFIIKNGAIPSPLNYRGFPKSICTSVNDVVCHGIPRADEILKDGDIINVDITTKLDGWHGDCSGTFEVGKISKENEYLIDHAYIALKLAICQVKPGNKLNMIGGVIEKSHLRMMTNLSIVQEYCGHGIGRNFHEPPNILHFTNDDQTIMEPGMIFTIEPMINAGTRHVKLMEDGWTVKTEDGKNSAQFEHTVLVTETGYDILTLP